MPDFPDRFLFEVEGLSQTLRVLRFSAQEAVSEPFWLEITVACDDGAVAFEDAIGQPALLTMQTDGEPRYLHGMIARFQQGDFGKKVTTYHATIVPRVFRLEHRHDCRIFQELKAPEIIQKVFEAAGLAVDTDFRLSLSATYRVREYCVQYRESDWAFACRLMESEGIYYFFEHEVDKHVLVLGDAPTVHPPIPGDATVLFRAPLGALAKGEHIHRFHYAEELRSGGIALRDYNFKKPTLLLESKAAAVTFADLEVYDYPGEYDVPADGDGLAKVRLQERQTLRRAGEGEGACERLGAGHLFTLSEHARESFNREYLVTRVEHQGSEPSMMDGAGGEVRYENRFHCIPSDVPFRPPLRTPKPSIRGVQSAIVVGPAGEEIHTDEHGRVKVQFPWDRLGKSDDKSSCWIRVSQVWAGEAWGAMHIPRVKQEVLVDFLDGDPDRPIIVGRVYHGANVPPYALPGERTKSTIKSNSTPGGGGSNELRFEDKKGSEEIFLHGQKDWTIGIENDKNQTVGNDETLKVTNDRAAEVGHDEQLKVGNDETYSVGHDRKKSVGNDETESIGNNRTIDVAKDHTESIGQNLSLTVGKTKTEDVTEDSTATVGKSLSITVGKDHALDVTGNMSTTVGSNQSEDVKLEKTLTVGDKISITCGDTTVTIEKDGTVKVNGKDITVTGTGTVKVDAAKVEVKSSGDVKIESSGKIEVKTSGAMDVNASGAVKVKGSNVAIN